MNSMSLPTTPARRDLKSFPIRIEYQIHMKIQSFHRFSAVQNANWLHSTLLRACPIRLRSGQALNRLEGTSSNWVCFARLTHSHKGSQALSYTSTLDVPCSIFDCCLPPDSLLPLVSSPKRIMPLYCFHLIPFE